MTDRIILTDMRFEARHGVHDWERHEAQAFEVDVELILDLRLAGTSDDLAQTVDYSAVYETVRRVVESTSRALIESIAEQIGRDILDQFEVTEVGVRVRKPGVRLGGPLAHASVEIWRRRSGSAVGGPGPKGH